MDWGHVYVYNNVCFDKHAFEGEALSLSANHIGKEGLLCRTSIFS